MTTVPMKTEDVIKYCEKAIAYWMVAKKDMMQQCSPDACPEEKLSFFAWKTKDILKAKNLIKLSKIAEGSMMQVNEDILEIIDVSKRTYRPFLNMWETPDRVLTDEDIQKNKSSSGATFGDMAEITAMKIQKWIG